MEIKVRLPGDGSVGRLCYGYAKGIRQRHASSVMSHRNPNAQPSCHLGPLVDRLACLLGSPERIDIKRLHPLQCVVRVGLHSVSR
jgi:hypothetical protein